MQFPNAVPRQSKKNLWLENAVNVERKQKQFAIPASETFTEGL